MRVPNLFGEVVGGSVNSADSLGRRTHFVACSFYGTVKCIVCYLCVLVCPVDCIVILLRKTYIRASNRWVLDKRRCITCSGCTVNCPVVAITQRVISEQSLSSRHIYGQLG